MSVHGRRKDFFQVVAESILLGRTTMVEFLFTSSKLTKQSSVENVSGYSEFQDTGVTKAPLPNDPNVSVFK